jgi:flagellar hook-length control protein FliK
MSIAIVPALPQATPSQAANVANAANAAVEADPSGFVQDFTSLLLGRLAAARLGGGALPGMAANDSGKAESKDDDAESADALELLAALIQAPFEQRGAAAPADGALPAMPSARTIPADDSPAGGKALAQALSGGERLPGPASEPAAKFAAPLEISGENEPALPAAANLAASAPARADDTARPIPVATPLHDRAWGDDFAQKVAWVATHHRQSAELTLNPPAMGSIEISLRIDPDKSAAATFVSANAEVRETLETALPRLREMLAGAGITLGEAQVSAESFRQAPGNERNAGEGASPARNESSILMADPQVQAGVSVAGAGRGLVDMFV